MRLTTAAERQVRKRHPWVFDGSIQTQNREGMAGDLAVIFDKKDKFLAVGLYDPHSPIRIRVLHAGKPAPIHKDWWESKLLHAIRLRREVQTPDTTGLRWIYGENDGWPGLVLDGYEQTLVVKLYSTAWFPHLEEQLSLFQQHLPCERIILRLSRNIQSLPAPNAHWTDGAVLFGPPPDDAVIFQENGIRMRADVRRGQKTGFFLDQRDNRRRVGSISRGKSVLNLFSFSGGFSLHAAAGGATSVTNVDISEHALRECEANWQLNTDRPGFLNCQLANIQADVFRWLDSHRKSYDIVIIDPPSLAKRRSDREDALKAYRMLALAGQRLTRPGGTLLCCSCSAHVSREDFVNMLEETLGGRFQMNEITRHAPDHPHGMAELDYLKAVYFSAPKA
ncbi:MAG: class I SAM-dependent methyltransferase [Verrucomicrobiota bacterium]